MDNLDILLQSLKLKDEQSSQGIVDKIQDETCITKKCILARNYLQPQSTVMEKVVMKDLLLNKPKDEVSGDATKNEINYEIKFSGHAKRCKFNFVQIRPHHKIDYYILIGYNMYHSDPLGKTFVFKVPSEIMYEWVVKHGGYAHGTCKKLGDITIENMKNKNCEYALRVNPNAKKGKDFTLWNEMLKYEVEYSVDNF